MSGMFVVLQYSQTDPTPRLCNLDVYDTYENAQAGAARYATSAAGTGPTDTHEVVRLAQVDTDEDAARLGVRIRGRREQLGLSVTRAVKAAGGGISRPTWERAEQGLPIRDTGYAPIERVLCWTVGSVRMVLDGGDPVPLQGDRKPGAACCRAAVQLRALKEMVDLAVQSLDEGSRL